ncbi:MAG: hypothetical protein N2Z68_00405 [Patescibacteria group bacterium]|nr:hypothetical protein [Patescibacteria group bacterium]
MRKEKNIFGFLKTDFLNNKGQAVLMVVLVLGATMLGITTIAGFISLEKIKTGGDVIRSAEAIYAADSGIECYFYKIIKDPQVDCNLSLSNGSTVSVATSTDGVYEVIKSVGKSGKVSRAFGVFLEQQQP